MKFLAPEVVQTSGMDCGPASLKCLLEGFGIRASYGRLREACQTDVDGTSIDTLEEVARRLGLDAEQIMVPVDHLVVPEAKTLPAIVVTRRPDGLTHFVVVWRRHGRWLQVMDPATGRRWVPWERFREEVYEHRHVVPAADWREWSSSEEFQVVLARRMEGIGADGARLRESALADAGWRGIASLDAATRMVSALVRAGGVDAGGEASRLLGLAYERAEQSVPAGYWSVRPADNGTLSLRGAVLVRVRGRRAPELVELLSPELKAAISEPPVRPGREVFRLLREGGLLSPLVLLLAFAFAAGGTIVEALLFRGLFDLGRLLGVAGQRWAAAGVLLLFLGALLLLEFPLAAGTLRLGRHLEIRLRSAFLEKLPKLADRYFRSRPSSDMAERSHSLHVVRSLPLLAGHFVRTAFELGVTTIALVWLHPRGAPLAIATAAVSMLVPLALQPLFAERDLRVRTHGGALSRFYLDALLGLVPVRTHTAQRALRRQHEGLLVEWTQAGFRLQRLSVVVEGILALVGFALSGLLLASYLRHGGEIGGSLLVAYWSLSLPLLGAELALVARQIPGFRNVVLRLVEPLGAPDETPSVPNPAPSPAGPSRLEFQDVAVRASGHTLLEGVHLVVEPGTHLAIVGPSGAGKSTLVGLILGLHRPSAGRLLVDGEPLDEERARRDAAWVDPEVQLWNRSLLENLRYGSDGAGPDAIRRAIEDADLAELLRKLPAGLETPLGEGGALVSGGEGQRVRLARAMLRPAPRVVVLDEPFRGLDREQRRRLLDRARARWKDTTLLCVTHDVGETRGFDRVVVVEGGRIVEHDVPAKLEADGRSRYRALLDAERDTAWSGVAWRRLRVEEGRLEAAR